MWISKSYIASLSHLHPPTRSLCVVTTIPRQPLTKLWRPGTTHQVTKIGSCTTGWSASKIVVRFMMWGQNLQMRGKKKTAIFFNSICIVSAFFYTKLNITYLIQHHITDDRQALRLVHTGADELAAQEELPVVPLLVLRVYWLPFFCTTYRKYAKAHD